MSSYEGKLEKIGVFELKDSQKTGFNADKTHQISIIVDNGPGHFISVGTVEKKSEYDLTWRRKIGEEYFNIFEDADIEFMYDVKDGYWNIRSGTLNIIKNGTKEPKSYSYHKANNQNKSTSPKSTYKRDYSGIEIGHALNCGLWVSKHSLKDVSKILEISKNMHEITKKLKGEHKEKNPEMSDYDLGASVGNAVLNACRVGGPKDIIELNAKRILDELVPVITAYVRGEEIKKSVSDEQDMEMDDDLPF